MQVVKLSAALLLTLGSAALSQPTNQKIDPDVYRPYRQKDFPRTFARYGAENIAGPIQKLRERGAEVVAQRSDCDFVEYAELSDQATFASLVVFVDCRNGARFYVHNDLRVEKRR